MEEMATITEVIDALRRNGYETDLNLRQDLHTILDDDFVIDHVYRFEGNTDPADEATVYAISNPKHHLKGILVNGAGIYSNELTDKLLEKLQTHPHPDAPRP